MAGRKLGSLLLSTRRRTAAEHLANLSGLYVAVHALCLGVSLNGISWL